MGHTARKEKNAAREDAAKLRGQVEAMQPQAAELVLALSERLSAGADSTKQQNHQQSPTR